MDSFRCLGVILDKNFCFLSHANFLKKWISTRCNVLKLLRANLQVSPDVLLRVCQTFRSRMLFGTWWTLCCSTTTLGQLEVYFSKCIRASVGFNRFVPTKMVSNFTGVDLISDYLPYWLGSRSTIDYMRENFDMFAEFKSEYLCRHASKYNLRTSTTEQSIEATRRAQSIFPETAVARFGEMEAIRDRGILYFRQFGPNFKMKLKKSCLQRIIARGTITQSGVDQLNKRYYDRNESE